MSIITLFGAIAIVTSFIGLLPQIVKSFKTKSTEDISMIMVMNYLICSLSWIIYSVNSDWVVFFSNVLGFFTGLILVFQKKYYDAK